MSTKKIRPVPGEDSLPIPPEGDKGVLRGKLTGIREFYATTEDTRTALKSLIWRNRRPMLPWTMALVVASWGAGGVWLSSVVEGPLAFPVALGSGLVIFLVGWLVYRKYAERIDKVSMTGRVRIAIIAASVWCGALPLVGLGAVGVWTALILITVVLSARWWQRIRPAYPVPSVRASPVPIKPTVRPKPMREIMTPVRCIIDAWGAHVGNATGCLPHSRLSDPYPIERGASFVVHLVAGKQTVEDLRTHAGKIASAIGYFPELITFERGDVPAEAIMRVVIEESVAIPYQGPKIIIKKGGDEKGDDVWIELGPFIDGEGPEKYHVFGPNSVNSGFLLGSKGSGKSRLLELLAIGFRQLGIEIFWLDPQDGACSAALKEHADWSLMGISTPEDPVGNIQRLYRALQRIVTIRQKENAIANNDGFTHSRERPAIMVIIDECHQVFGLENPDTENTFGHDFGELDRVMRKLGIGLLGASQIYTMDTFGTSAVLRSGLIAGNLLVLRMMEKSHAGLLPANAPSPWTIPKGGGYGYSIDSDRPYIMWRAEEVEDPARWLSSIPRATLDARAMKAAGPDYLQRHEAAQEHLRRAAAALDSFDAADPFRAMAMLRPNRSEGNPVITGVSSRPSGAVVIPLPRRDLSEKEREFLLAFDGRDRTVAQLAESLAISEEMVRRYIRAVGESRLAKVGAGVYRVTAPVAEVSGVSP